MNPWIVKASSDKSIPIWSHECLLQSAILGLEIPASDRVARARQLSNS